MRDDPGFGSQDVVPMPIAEEILVSHALGAHDEVTRLIDASPLEAWFGISPDRLSVVLDALPPEVTGTSVAIRAFRLFLRDQAGAPEAPGAPAPADPGARDVRAVGDFAAQAFTARVHGKPASVSQAVDGSAELLTAANVLFDGTGGLHAFLSVQHGITQMLAGDLHEALQSFAAATRVPPPRSLTVLLRDAYTKSALVHALFGSPDVARRNLDIAAALPRTTSWAEAIVSAHAAIADAALSAGPEVAAAGADRLTRLPVVVVGEMWPFWLDAVFRLHAQAGEAERGLAQVIELSRATPAGEATEGFPGNILPLTRALAAVVTGDLDGARAQLAAVAPRMWPAVLLRAYLDVAAGDTEGGIRMLVALGPRSRGLPKLDATRRALLAYATLRDGDEERAIALLAPLAGPEAKELRGQLIFVPPEVDEFAAASLPGWTSASTLAAAPATEHTPFLLTPREREVLRLLASERSRAQIAEHLSVSLNTVKSQQRAIYRKLGVSSRVQALIEAERHGLL